MSSASRILLLLIPRACYSFVSPQPQPPRRSTARAALTDFETFVRPGAGIEGVHAANDSSLALRVLERVPELATWRGWYRPPALLGRNGHAHTIWAAKARATRACRYARALLPTPDGGTLALDLLDGISRREVAEAERATTFRAPPDDGDAALYGRARPFVLLISGLGGGSQDTYVRSMAARAATRGWSVGVLNMRSCGDAPVTSPRFFSAHRGATDDVRVALEHLARVRGAGAPPIAALGWSNGGSIVVNALAEQAAAAEGSAGGGARIAAAAALATPLDMVANSRNLRRPFHRVVYDRAIGGSLATKFRASRALFEDAATGAPVPVPAWEGPANARGGGDAAPPRSFVADTAKAAGATTIRELDEAVTAPCFGFASVDDYYASASPGQRLQDVRTPLLVLSAYDDPIAIGPAIPFDAARGNARVVLAVTSAGGHLGWCDAGAARGAPAWVEDAALGFLEASLDEFPRTDECEQASCTVFD